MVFIGNHTITPRDTSENDFVDRVAYIERMDENRTIQFKLYNYSSPVYRDVIYATYSNPFGKSDEEVKEELVPCLNVPEDKVVVMSNCARFTQQHYDSVYRVNPEISTFYRDEDCFILVYRFSLEELEENRLMFNHDFNIVPLGRIITFDYQDEQEEEEEEFVEEVANYVYYNEDGMFETEDYYYLDEGEERMVERALNFDMSDEESDIEMVDEFYEWDD